MGQLSPLAPRIYQIQHCIRQFPFAPRAVSHSLVQWGYLFPLFICQVAGIRLSSFFFHVSILPLSFAFVNTASKDNDETIVYYSDGSYSIISITYEDAQPGISPAAARSSRRGTKDVEHYNSSKNLVWTFTVYGEFTYDGRSATATDSDYSYRIYDSEWSFVSGSASYSGATARATGKFSWYGTTSSASVSLTCSANGTLS